MHKILFSVTGGAITFALVNSKPCMHNACNVKTVNRIRPYFSAIRILITGTTVHPSCSWSTLTTTSLIHVRNKLSASANRGSHGKRRGTGGRRWRMKRKNKHRIVFSAWETPCCMTDSCATTCNTVNYFVALTTDYLSLIGDRCSIDIWLYTNLHIRTRNWHIIYWRDFCFFAHIFFFVFRVNIYTHAFATMR